MQKQIYEMLVTDDEVTWQTLLYDLIKKEEMSPWDIDVSLLTQQYISTLKSLKEHNFRISGKVVLAAALLLKMKSTRFVGEDMLEIDRLIHAGEEVSEEEFYDELAEEFHTPGNISDHEKFTLIPRTPQPRKRKVSIYDLMNALDKALEVRRRRILNAMPGEEELTSIPARKVDLHKIIKGLFSRIKGHFSSGNTYLSFSQLLTSEDKEDKIYTFLPLLHLSNMQKVELEQKEHFGEIAVHLIRSGSKKELEQAIQ